MEYKEEDFSVSTASSGQRLSSSPEFSTIMNVMKFARRSLRSKRNTTLQVPQIKITLASEVNNDELAEVNMVETIPTTITESSSRNKSVFKDSGEDYIPSVLSNVLECETLISNGKSDHCSAPSVAVVVDNRAAVKQENVESCQSSSPREANQGHNNKTEPTKHKSRFEPSKALPLSMSSKDRPKSENLSYPSSLSTSQSKHSRKHIASTGRSKSLGDERGVGTEIIRDFSITVCSDKETETVKTNKMKLTRTQNTVAVKDLRWVEKIKRKGHGIHFNSQQHLLIENSVTTSVAAHTNKANEHSNVLNNRDTHNAKYIPYGHRNGSENEEMKKGNVSLVVSTKTGSNMLPLHGRRSRSFADISDVFSVRSTNHHLTNYHLRGLRPQQGIAESGVSKNPKNGGEMSSAMKGNANPAKATLSRKISRSDPELHISTTTSSATKLSRKKPQKIDLTLSRDRRNNFDQFNGEHDNVFTAKVSSAQLTTHSGDYAANYNRGRSSSFSAPRAERLPLLGSPTTNRRASTIPAPRGPIGLTPPVERRFSPSSPSPSRSRSNSWSNLLTLSKVFDQINQVYAQVRSSSEEVDKLPDVHVDEVLKSWNVRQDDMQVIRSVVQSPRRDLGFSSADYEQLKGCRYLRNEADLN